MRKKFAENKGELNCDISPREAIVPFFDITSSSESDWRFWRHAHITAGWKRLNNTPTNQYMIYEFPKHIGSQAENKKLMDRIDKDTFDGHRLIQKKDPNVRWFIKYNPKVAGKMSFGEIVISTGKELWRCDP